MALLERIFGRSLLVVFGAVMKRGIAHVSLS